VGVPLRSRLPRVRVDRAWKSAAVPVRTSRRRPARHPGRLSRLEAAGLLERDAGEPRSGKQAYHATAKGKDLIPLLLQMMAWSAAHDPHAAVPGPLLAAITADLPAAARAIGDLGGVEPFLAALPAASPDLRPAPVTAPPGAGAPRE
jgi:HxlR-like helix-turn-helix